ncbi:hypothetical protein B0T24DRAFT_130719 [Lasiosphaeria ovina]|uniref:Uncharacterized protein n=1 Tax=Lasiosphaeria ovina TaxID=92902 RepID=A0AAE0JRR7_9PEZI|nr:hypothetical protein B0T24DRAFT_130719 [Lasiosphaeria ovina]
MSHSTQSQGPYPPQGVKENPILIDSSSPDEIVDYNAEAEQAPNSPLNPRKRLVEDTDMDEADAHVAMRGRNTIRGVDEDAIELFSRREGLVSLDAMIAALTHGTDNEKNEFIAEGNEEFYALASVLDYADRDDSDAAVNQDLSTDESVLVSYDESNETQESSTDGITLCERCQIPLPILRLQTAEDYANYAKRPNIFQDARVQSLNRMKCAGRVGEEDGCYCDK